MTKRASAYLEIEHVDVVDEDGGDGHDFRRAGGHDGHHDHDDHDHLAAPPKQLLGHHGQHQACHVHT